ncbi:hypothetical protein K1X13_17155 [Nocardioides sp. WL0053]|uniref:Uncharacterized protein n=1 Tax=Nocardioides jiangsuensis TaxID=2866161 RepID=A0ABS7RNM7_9ACTN|nr:hypothetical protein [Nocardioides jiangsuensis]MBY9076566.1 hypothetical protein [Nocardioides jiangsuensis]
MNTTTIAAPVDDPHVELWRFERLRAAHCPPDVAMTLATSRDVDLHRALGLLAGGCPPETAQDILL